MNDTERTVAPNRRITLPVEASTAPCRRLQGDNAAHFGGRRGGDDGYALALFTLLLIPMMVFVAFAVDLGAWYAQSSRLQRATDAASMAGVVWLPDTTKALDAAKAAAKLNGFDPAVYTMTPIIPLSGTDYGISITAPATRIFSQIFQKYAINLTRSATARFNKKIPLGSPSNQFGNDVSSCPQFQPASSGCGTQPMLWTAINGPYELHANGDAYNTKCSTAGGSGTPANCDDPANTYLNGAKNKEYRKTGNDYAIDVSAADLAAGYALTLQIWDAGSYARTTGTAGTLASPGLTNTTASTTAGSTTLNISTTGPQFGGYKGWVISGPTLQPQTMITSVTSSTSVQIWPAAASTSGSTTINFAPDCNAVKAPFTGTFPSGFGSSNCQTGDTGSSAASALGGNGLTGSYTNVDMQIYQNDGSDLSIDYSATLPSCSTGSPNFRLLAATVNSFATYRNKWVSTCTFTPTKAGIYPVRLKESAISGVTDGGTGTNGYSLKVTGGVTTRLYAINDMSLWTNTPASTSKFYLAEVGPENAGKTMILDMYDPGDGSGSADYYIKLRGPAAAVPAQNPMPAVPTGGTALTGCVYNDTPSPSILVTDPTDSAPTCQVLTHTSGGVNKYNDNWLRLEYKIPSTYDCGPTKTMTDCWFSIQYDFGGSLGVPTDRTIWALTIKGDPVHLIG